MVRTCIVKLGKAPKQEQKLLFVLGLCRDLYNAALQQRIKAYEKQHKSISKYDQQKELTELRAVDEDFSSIPVEMTRLTATTKLDNAFRSFFRRLKTGEEPGFPRYKSKDRFDTLVFGKVGWKIKGKLLIIKAGSSPIVLHMKNAIHRKGEIIGLRLTRKSDRWWAHFLVDIGPAPEVKEPEKPIAADIGTMTFATLSDDNKIEHPHFIKKSLEKIKEAQRVLSRKKKGSKNRKKAKKELSRIYDKVSNKRNNFLNQEVAKLCKTYDGFAVEDLDIENMVDSEREIPEMTEKGKRGLRRNIMDSAWGTFFNKLGNKAEEAGFPVKRVDPKGTSQRCSCCGTIVKKSLKDRVHVCPVCGLVMGRDLNSAKEVFNLGFPNNLGCRLATGVSSQAYEESAEVSGAETKVEVSG